MAGDNAWAEKYLAEDWIACDSSGKWYTKDDMRKMMADPKNNKYNSEVMSDLKVRVYGTTAVATYKDTYDAMVQGEHRTRAIPRHRRLGEDRRRVEAGQLARHNNEIKSC